MIAMAVGGMAVCYSPAAFAQTPADQPITRYTFRNLAKETAPAVVNIKIKSNIVFGGPGSRHMQIPPNFGFDDDMRKYLEKLFERESPHMTPDDEEDYKYSRSGSGVIIRGDGYLVTSEHVVHGASDEDIEVSLADGRTFSDIKMIGSDELTDLAVLKIQDANTSGLPSIEWGNSDEMEVGDHVMAIGNPLEFNNSVSEGIISAKHRIIKKAPLEDLIQTTAMINPGNSGGALVNLDGKLIGINMAIATSTGMWSGLGFAIPSHTAREVCDQIINKGKVLRGYLGIEMEPLTMGLAQQLGYKDNYGIVVKTVTPGSPAEKAGLQRYDIISSVNGNDIKELADMHRNIGARHAGDNVTVELFRDEGGPTLTSKTLTVALGERPSQDQIESMTDGKKATEPPLPGVKPNSNLLGLQVERNSDGTGLKINSIAENSPAKSDLQKGDIIVEVNKQKVNSPDDLRKALGKSNTGFHMFYIERGTNSLLLDVPAE